MLVVYSNHPSCYRTTLSVYVTFTWCMPKAWLYWRTIFDDVMSQSEVTTAYLATLDYTTLSFSTTLNCKSFGLIHWLNTNRYYSGDPKTDPLKSGFIQNPDFLRSVFEW